MVKMVEYRGVIYRRYEGRLYYNPSGTLLGSKRGTSLHRQVWLDAGNAIPAGWHVHHIDGDHDNNDIANLTCLPADVHSREHIRERLAPNGDLGQTLAAWRASPGGRRQLRKNAAKMLASTPERQCACEYCGAAFITRNAMQRFCTEICAQAVPNAACEICGKLFRQKPHNTKRVRTCSYQCGWELRRQNAA